MTTPILPPLTPALSIEQARMNHDQIETALNSWPEETRRFVPSRNECPDATQRAQIMQENLPLAIRVEEAQQARETQEGQQRQRREDDQKRLRAESYWQNMPESERQQWREKGVYSARELLLNPDQVKAFEALKQSKSEGYKSFI